LPEGADAPTARRRCWGSPHPATGRPRDLQQFTGGPLARVSFELDGAYYGAAHQNRGRLAAWSAAVLFAGLRQFGILRYGPATPSPEDDLETLTRPRPRLDDTTYWIRFLHLLEEPASLPAHGWENCVAWRLDVLLGLAELPRSRWRAFRLYADGWGYDDQRGRKDLSEIAARMGRDHEAGESWSEDAVRVAIRQARSHGRRRAEFNVPAPDRSRAPRPGTPTTEIQHVERLWARMPAREGAR